MTEKQRKTRAELNKLGITTVAGAATLAHNPAPALAIDITTVSTDISTIITSTDSAADVAWPIGAALMALAVIGTVFKKFVAG